MVSLTALPYWARVGSAVGLMGTGYFVASALTSVITGAGADNVFFDLLLAGAFALLTTAVLAKARPQHASSDRRPGPLDY